MTAEICIALASLGLNIIVIAFLMPMRRAVARVAELESKIDEINIDTVKSEIKHVKARVISLEERERADVIELPKNYVTKADMIRSEQHRDSRFDQVNEKIDAAVIEIAKVGTTAEATNKQVDTIFRLWNEEHRRK